MIQLDYRPDGNFVLTAPARFRDYCKQVPGLKFKNIEDAYSGPATWTAAQTIQGVLGSRPEFSITEAARAHVQHLADEMSSIIKIKRSEELMVAEPFTSRNGLKLFPWQMNDAAVLAHLRRGIDTSDRGTGKGPKVISTLRMLYESGVEVFPHVTFTRPFARGAIRDEWLAWFPELADEDVVILTEGMSKKARNEVLNSDAKVFVLDYHFAPLHSRISKFGNNALTEIQRTPKELNGKFKSVFVDEMHRIIEPNLTSRAIWSILDEVDIKYGATGSPIADAPDDMWGLLRALWPLEFPSRVRYIERYCNMVPQFFGPDRCDGLNPATAEEWRQIWETKHVRRDKSDVLKDLPEKTYETISSPMTGKQLKYYTQLSEKGLVEIDGVVMTATDPLTRRTRLMQLSFGTPKLGLKKSKQKDEATGEMINTEIVAPVELTMPSNKVDAMLDALATYDEPMIVWTAGRLELDLCAKQLEKAGIDYVQFAGGMREVDREAGRRRFQAGDVRVALCLLQVASEALTLTAAPLALYLQREDSMIDSTQSEDRIHRIGQTKNVLIVDHITEGSEEVKVHENYLAKEQRSNTALNITREQRTVA